jgi:hypothetical protein
VFNFTGRAEGTATIWYKTVSLVDSNDQEVPDKETHNITIDVRFGDEPVISSPSPNNVTGRTPHNHGDITASISDGDSGETINWWINTTAPTASGNASGSYTDGSGSTQVSCDLASELGYNTNYSWTIEVSDGHYHTSKSYYFVTRPQHTVTPPTGFTATATDKNTIQIDWSDRGENASHVWVEWQQDSYPSARGAGDGHNNDTIGFNHINLDPEEDWYYRAWSYDSTDNVWSTTYSEDSATTPANSPISIASPSPTNGSSNLQYPINQLSISLDDPENSINSWSIETTPDIGSNSGSGEGTKTASISPAYGTAYTWYVNATDDEGSTTRAWYTFDTTQSPTADNSSLTVDDGSTLAPGVTDLYWNITIEDPEGDAFDWDISCTNGDSTSGNDETNGTKSLHITGLSYGSTYTVTVTVENTAGTYTYIDYDYTFSTESDLSPQAYSPYPTNGSSGWGEGSLSWSCLLEDFEGTDQIFQWTIECSNGESNTGLDFGYGPINISVPLTGLTNGNTYTVWVNTSAGTNRPAGWFTFTVGGGPNNPATLGTPSPINGSADQDLVFQWSIPIDDSEDDEISYSIECSNGQTGSDTATSLPATGQLSLTGLAYSTTYTVWVNATDAGNGTTVREWFTFDTKDNVAPIIGTPSPANGSVNQSNSLQFSIPVSDTSSGATEDDDLDWTIECPGVDSDSGTGEGYGTKGLQLSGLSPDTWYTVYVNVTDGSLWTREWFTFHVANNTPPTIESPTPTHTQSDVVIGLSQVSVYINDTDAGDTPEYTIEGSFLTNVDTTGEGLVTATVSTSLAFNTTYTWYVNATDPAGSATWTNKTYTFTTESLSSPTGFAATKDDRTSIDLAWSLPTYADNTYIYRKVGSYPTNRSDAGATLIYSGTGTTYDDSGLDMNTTYYYRAWSYDNSRDAYSDTYSEDNAKTDANTLPSITVHPDGTDTDVTTILGGLVNYSDADGDQISITIYAGANWSARHTLATITDYDGEQIFTSPQMPYDSTIHMWINTTDGYGWNNETYTFETGSEATANMTLYYYNGTGYNFISVLNETLSTAGLGEIWAQQNVTEVEYLTQWDAEEQEYVDAYYVGLPGAIEATYTAGDVVLVSVTENITINSTGYAPTMAWEDYQVYQGYNWLGRTNGTVSAYEVGVELTNGAVNWTQLITWNATIQEWSPAFLPAYGSGSMYNFDIAAGETVMVSTTEQGVFNMYGW